MIDEVRILRIKKMFFSVDKVTQALDAIYVKGVTDNHKMIALATMIDYTKLKEEIEQELISLKIEPSSIKKRISSETRWMGLRLGSIGNFKESYVERIILKNAKNYIPKYRRYLDTYRNDYSSNNLNVDYINPLILESQSINQMRK